MAHGAAAMDGLALCFRRCAASRYHPFIISNCRSMRLGRTANNIPGKLTFSAFTTSKGVRGIYSRGYSAYKPLAVTSMAQAGRFAYTVMYVKDVAESVAFYEKAFGVSVRSLDPSKRWGELESGGTTIAFTPLKQHETDITGGVQTPDQERQNIELSFSFPDVDAAYKYAVSVGATAVAEPEDKVWGQRVGYVRDINNIMIRMGSELAPSK